MLSALAASGPTDLPCNKAALGGLFMSILHQSQQPDKTVQHVIELNFGMYCNWNDQHQPGHYG